MTTATSPYNAVPGDNLHLFRLNIHLGDAGLLAAFLSTQVRPEENKVHQIMAGGIVSFDVALSDDEMTFVALRFPEMKYSWLQPWTKEYAQPRGLFGPV